MKSPTFNIVLGSLILTTFLSCNKTETVGAYDQVSSMDETAQSEITETLRLFQLKNP